jgi:hypothetical protein
MIILEVVKQMVKFPKFMFKSELNIEEYKEKDNEI